MGKASRLKRQRQASGQVPDRRFVTAPAALRKSGNGEGSTSDLDRLRGLREQRQSVDAAIVQHVGRLRTNGASWRQIADVLAVTPQAAQQRYGQRA